ncbi:MAG: carboxypeptidase regulatory-like domain-containing protein [Acidobacteria bacterium]|nr:carboxypeptidase regulatory-like domain-containing protein [Acidobacteriota bacterium]
MKITRIILILLLAGLTVFGQTNKGGISGTVTDAAGAPIAGATVTITNLGTNEKTVLVTSNEGAYAAASLEPVVYNIRVEAPNFKKTVVDKVKVDTATVSTINVTLEAGTITESVTVEGDLQVVNTESGATGQTITERQLRDLPLNNRSVLDLAMTMPNVAGDAGTEDVDANSTQPVPGFNLTVNGGRPGSTTILADGVNNTGIGIARAVVSFTPETVQEFNVQSSAYSAEFGTTGGGVINVTTKSGTNQFAGTALIYHRNPATNAQPWRQGTAPRPDNNLRFTQGSLTIGGPVFLPAFNEGGPYLYNGKNRTFFFFGYEPRWRTDFVTGTALIPSARELAGDFTGLIRTNSGFLPTDVAARFAASGQCGTNCTTIGGANIYQQFVVVGGQLYPIILNTGNQYCQFGDPRAIIVNQTINGQTIPTPQCNSTINATPNPALNVIPQAFIDPIAVRLSQYMPTPGDYFLDNGLVRNYSLVRSVQQNETRYTFRLDHSFTDKLKANFRYSKTPAVGIRAAGNDINGNTGVYSDAKQFLLGFTYNISSSMINDLKLNYTRGNFSEDFSPKYAIKTGESFSQDLGLTALTKGGLPLIFLTQDNGYVGADLGAGGSTNNFNVEQRYNINDTFYWIKGNMSWKIGVDLSDARLNAVPFFAASGGRWQFRTVNTSNNRSTSLPNGGNDLASFLIGVPNAQDFRPVLLSYYYQWLSGAAFVQNDWKVKPNLTVNLGLRYSLQLPRTEKNNLQGVFRPDLAQTVTLTDTQRRAIATASGVLTTAAIPDYVPTTAVIPAFAFSGRGGRSRYLTPIDKTGWEPRFGFAYSPKLKIFGFDPEKYSLVIRGGFGISHAPINGNNRSPNPDFGGFTTASTLANGSTGGVNNAQPIRLTGNNALQGSSVPLDTLLGTDANGLVFGSSIAIPGVAVFSNDKGYGKVPYSENFNLAVQFSLFRGTTFELAYVGNRGVHLYTPQVNLNLRNSEMISFLESNGINATGTITDPLGRRTLLGAAVTDTIASLYTPYLGFDLLNKFFDPSSSSTRHAGYVDVRRRISRGLSFTANYTFAKSIDDASDASPDVRVLSTGSVRGQVGLGGTRQSDRAVSSFDVRHNFTGTFTYDLPFGKGRPFLKDAPWYLGGLVGGWTISGITRIQSGTPFQPFITDPNKLGGANLNRIVRPDIVSGVPLKNPLWDPKCRIGNACEPYINPAAFMRPVKGQLGNAPRTINLRAPWRQFFDFSIQKDFSLDRLIGGEGRRKLQFRVDLLNAFNHPIFQLNNLGNTPFGLGTFPTEITTENVGGTLQPITLAEYNAWATFNGQPTATSGGTGAGNVIYDQVRAMVNAARLPPRAGVTTGGALPNDFFHVQLPQGFATTNPLAFDIRTLNGFKLYRIRQTYDTNFGTLFAPTGNSRYLQFGIKLYF